MIPAEIIEQLVDALDSLSDESYAYFHKKTHEIYFHSSLESGMGWDDEEVEDEDEEDEELDESDWQQEERKKLREIRNSDDWLQLPSAYEVHAWEIMRDFALTMDKEVSERLLNAIHGNGAFRFFRSELDRLGLTDRWYEFKNESLKELILQWLASHDIPVEGKQSESGDE